MKSFWHPLSAVILTDPPTYATPHVVRMLLAGGPLEVRYAGDRMAFALRHGQSVTVERALPESIAAGDVVLACPNDIVDLLRVARVDAGAPVVTADADPGFEAPLGPGQLLGRARCRAKRVGAVSARLRRLVLDLDEAFTGRPDGEGDPAETVKGKYDAQAPHYAALASPEIEALLLARIRASVPEGGRILVAGSGTGRECFPLAAEGWRVQGVDFAPAMVALAREQAARRGLAIDFRVADLRTHEEPPRSLDAVVFTYDVYSFLPEKRERIELVRRMLAWLSADGVLFLSARRATSAPDRLFLTIQRLVARRPGTAWGASHTRWLTLDGTLRRSFVHVFTERALARELDAAGAAPENWVGGHVLVRRRESVS